MWHGTMSWHNVENETSLGDRNHEIIIACGMALAEAFKSPIVCYFEFL